MGSKSSGSSQAAPPPDPRLIEAQLKSLGIQDAAIEKMFANADRQMTNTERLLPLQERGMQFALDSAMKANTEASADREWALGRRGMLSDAQDRLVKEARDFNTEAKANELAGEASADVAKGYATARANAGRDLVSMGWKPGSGKFGGMIKQLASDEALNRASAATGARRDARQEGYALTDRATNALAGYPAMSRETSGSGASTGAGAQGAILQGVGGMQGALSGANGAYGQAGQAAANMGNVASNAYTGMSNAYQNDQGGGTDWGQIVSTGIGAAAMIWSDRRLKRDITRIGSTPGGHALYQFRYLWADDIVTGVMADEVAHVPGAVLEVDGFLMVDYRCLT